MIYNKEHNNVTKVLCYIITKDVNKVKEKNRHKFFSAVSPRF